MADDVQTITGVINGAKPLAAARLCNFVTAGDALLPAHSAWINTTLAAAIKESPNPWVDIQAFASRRGAATGYDNQNLSERRRVTVHNAVLQIKPSAGLIEEDKAFGDSRSGGDANDNEGYWRAVEVYAYGSLPPNRAPDPSPPKPPPHVTPPQATPASTPGEKRPDWWVTSLSLGGASLVWTVGGGFANGTIGFKNYGSGENLTDHITIGGLSIGGSAGLDKLGAALMKNAFVEKAINLVHRFLKSAHIDGIP